MSISDDKSKVEDKLEDAIEKYIRENLKEPKYIIVNGYSRQRILNYFNDMWSKQGLTKWSMCTLSYHGYIIASTSFLGLEDSIEIAS